MAIRRKMILGSALLAAMALTFPIVARHSAATAAPRPEEHPVIHQALDQLRATREMLAKEGAHDFKGHRVAAIKHIDAAIEELKLALASARH
ncbi:MAG TPA: hypothetical protein VLX32_09595 [Candidatus Acidoferrum sp.]|nr:hypothetical protein [Candidatus Acidoferrum sp.]